MLEDGRVLEVRNVVWCTGFRGDYTWIEGLACGDDGRPDQDHGVVPEAPGHYFVRLRFQRAFASQLIVGVGRDAAHVVREITTRATAMATNVAD
jgi:putative flavoprotein involved in K+ transport